MLKKCLAVMLAALVPLSFAACQDDGSPAPQRSDFQKNMHQADLFMLDAMCETEEGVYFYYDGLYFIDKASKTATIVCGKPDCDHHNGNCNARIDPDSLWTDGSRLYYTTEPYDDGPLGNLVCSVERDGTNRRELQQLDPEVGGDNTFVVNRPIFHRGYVYYEYNDVIYRVPLGGDSKDAEALLGEDAGDGGIYEQNGMTYYNAFSRAYQFWADGDFVYILTYAPQSDGTNQLTLYSYDTNSKELMTAWVAPTVDVIGEYEAWDRRINGETPSMSQWYLKDGNLYLFFAQNGLWRYSLETGEYQKLTDTTEYAEYGSAVFSDEGMVLLNDAPEWDDFLGKVSVGKGHVGGDRFVTFDLSGKPIKEIPLDGIAGMMDGVTAYHLLAQADGCLYLAAEATVKSELAEGVQTTLSQRLSMFCVDLNTGEITFVCNLKE